MSKSNKVFFLTMIIGTLITMSSNNWISMWMGLELNMLSFMPLIKSKNKSSSEASMIYFLIQSMSSMILLFSIIYCMGGKEMQLFVSLGYTVLMIKLGSAPFHMWFPEMMSKMKWEPCILLMTWQKLAPLMMISNLKSDILMYMAVMASTILGAIGGLNQTSLRKIMSYSSINHLGWMLAINKMQNNWSIYWIMYTIMSATICYMFNKYNMFFINQINDLNMTNTEKITYAISMLSLGGLPPFLGFLPKWIAIQTLMWNNMYTIVMIMTMMSLITLFFYMRSMMSMLINLSDATIWTKTNSNLNMNIMILSINFSLPIIMMMNIK
uniref:NADH-ubiquinone oxidoreductase chain 2 n=1 Tax=Geotomus sp. FS-2019 TaxID=2575688 RepID=A0A4D6X058_9HEMI|nr:NADH dehydrogenase subunit 2 [Geotomus sp. FS-2019]